MSLSINILVSTIDKGIQKVPNVLQKEQSGVTYIIVHQYTDEVYKAIPAALLRSDVRIEQVPGRGLSKSRNRAIELADADIAIITDDDVRYFDDTFDNIRNTYNQLPDADAICFKIKTSDEEGEYKEYASQVTRMKRRLPHYLSSIEITFKVNPIQNKAILFDTRFGLGGDIYKLGGEDIFIDECIKKGYNVYFVPTYIVSHKYESTNKALDFYGSVKNELVGAIHSRKYGWKAFPKAFSDTMSFFSEH